MEWNENLHLMDVYIHTCVETLAMCVRLSPGEESLGTRALGIIWAGKTGGQHAWLTTIAYRMVVSEDSEKVRKEKW